MSTVAETYRRASDDELAAFHADIGSLTDEARDALHTEISRRGLTDEQITSKNEAQKRDQEEQKQLQLEAKRKRPVRWLLTLAQIGIVLVVAAFAMMCLGLINITPGQDEAAGAMFTYAVLFTLGVCLTWFRGKIWLTAAIAALIDAVLLVFLRVFANHSR
jgi:magnesium-transporting ATPase (P-type)